MLNNVENIGKHWKLGWSCPLLVCRTAGGRCSASGQRGLYIYILSAGCQNGKHVRVHACGRMLKRTWQVYFCDLLWYMPARCTWGSPERSSGQLSKASWALWTTWFRDANWHFKSMHRLVGALRDAPSCIICCKSIRMQHAEHVEETSTWGIEVDAKSRRSSSTALQQCRAIAALSPHYWILVSIKNPTKALEAAAIGRHQGNPNALRCQPPDLQRESSNEFSQILSTVCHPTCCAGCTMGPAPGSSRQKLFPAEPYSSGTSKCHQCLDIVSNSVTHENRMR